MNTTKKSLPFIGFLLFCLACGGSEDDVPAMPTLEATRIESSAALVPLTDEWENKFACIKDKPNVNDLKENVQKLKPANRNSLYELVNVAEQEGTLQAILEDLVSFSKADQANLINILLYLESRNKPLTIKLVKSDERFSVFEKLKMLNIIHDMDKASQHILEKFEDQLEEED
jgi:hypothetical protein